MDKIFVAFYKKKERLLDKLIMFTSRGPYSHVELILPTLGSISSSPRDNGTRFKEISKMNFNDKDKWDIFELDLRGFGLDINKLTKYFEETKTSKDLHNGRNNYDFLSVIFYHILRLNFLPKIKKNHFICSEFVWEALENILVIKEENIVTKEYSKRYREFNKGYKFTPANVLTSLTAMGLIKKILLEGDKDGFRLS